MTPFANGDDVVVDPSIRTFSPATQAIHADDYLNRGPDVAPALHVSTTFRYTSNPDDLIPARDLEVCPPTPPLTKRTNHPPHNQHTPPSSSPHVYSRETAPTTTRLEALLTPLLHAPCLTYSSGLAALHAAYVFLHPRRVSIGGGYHGSHSVLGLHARLTGLQTLRLDCPAEDLHPGDVVHLETPVNPTGEAFEIAKYAEKAHARGAWVLVDATFGPPGLQEPFRCGADVVMHSGTKFLGGHSDMLCGVLATRREEWIRGLARDRTSLGSVMGSFEGWLGVRSLRTLELRVGRQSESAERLVRWLAEEVGKEGEVGRAVVEVRHASLQEGDMPWLRKQMPNGFGPVFAIWMRDEALARRLPSKLALFHHATSLGGVESLIEWRTMSDTTVDTRLLRVSVGVEKWEDLRDDLLNGFRELYAEQVSEQ